MPDAITNTSPLVYLHRIQNLEWLATLFDEICLWVTSEIRRHIFDLAGEP